MSSDDEEVDEITRALEQIQLDQAALTQRQATLTRRLSEIARKESKTTRIIKDPNRAFAIGDKARIKNPKYRQEETGTVTRIGNFRITVTTDTGTKITRAPHNLAHEDHE
jgi:exoribonuclease R